MAQAVLQISGENDFRGHSLILCVTNGRPASRPSCSTDVRRSVSESLGTEPPPKAQTEPAVAHTPGRPSFGN